MEWERIEISSRKRDTKRIFHAKMDTVKQGNGMNLTEAEDIKKRGQEYMGPDQARGQTPWTHG